MAPKAVGAPEAITHNHRFRGHGPLPQVEAHTKGGFCPTCSFFERVAQGHLPTCSVPCDHVPVRSWPLFRAWEVMPALIKSLRQELRS